MTTLFETQSNTCNVNQETSILGGFLPQMRHILKQYTVFNITFLSLGIVEILCCLIFFNLMTHSHLIAITIAVFLMTLFSYFTLKIYFQHKKPQSLLSLCRNSLNNLQKKTEQMSNPTEKSLFIASSLTRLANALKDCEYSFYQPPKSLESLRLSFEKVGCWLHWKDLHLVKEWLYLQTVEIYINLIKEEPDHLQFHMALANTYVMFSGIYSLPKNEEISEVARWIPSEKQTEKIKAKFTQCAKRAIEEFKILNDYNPEDPWVYTQLAYSYHDLQMPQEEIKAYEKIIELAPEDYDSYYKLGTLYFQQGQIAKGLKIYEQLKYNHSHKATNLIKHYGSFTELFSLIE
ncbi:MAG: hypothetical protein S4CHLAM6_03180 [Chlamydiae bacterium]|nr:hypothetical protein [Chlamydiota bacterium]